MPGLSGLLKIKQSPQCRAQGVFSCSVLLPPEVCSALVPVGMAEELWVCVDPPKVAALEAPLGAL